MSQDLNPVIWPMSARRVNGEITIGDISVSDLADEFETPAFILLALIGQIAGLRSWLISTSSPERLRPIDLKHYLLPDALHHRAMP